MAKVEIYVVELSAGHKALEIFVPERLSEKAEKALRLYWVDGKDWIMGSSNAKPGQYNYYLMPVSDVEEVIEKYKNVNSIEDIVKVLVDVFKKKGWDVEVKEISLVPVEERAEEVFKKAEETIEELKRLEKAVNEKLREYNEEKLKDSLHVLRVELSDAGDLEHLIENLRWDVEHPEDDPEWERVIRRDLAQLEQEVMAIRKVLKKVSARQLADDVIKYYEQIKGMEVESVNQYPIFKREEYFISIGSFFWSPYHVYFYRRKEVA